MCGIFGMAIQKDCILTKKDIFNLITELYRLSESRGKESAGIHIYLPESGKTFTQKGNKSATELLASRDFQELLNDSIDSLFQKNYGTSEQPLILMAHSRLVTNGTAERPENNQPVQKNGTTVIHNGIVVNVDEIWNSKKDLTRHAEVDTEIIASIIDQSMDETPDPLLATAKVYATIIGSASIAWSNTEFSALTLATNTGDLFTANVAGKLGVVFASESFILDSALKILDEEKRGENITHLKPNSVMILDLSQEAKNFVIKSSTNQQIEHRLVRNSNPVIPSERTPSTTSVPKRRAALSQHNEKLVRYNRKSVAELRRCTCCILPESFPFIDFDELGVCNYCRNYVPKYKHMNVGEAKTAFIASLEQYRKHSDSPDVLVPFSGGRDSCYGLHLIKKEFDLNPITFTYDWGMVTDLARRNVARLCGKLGVQNILVSADIKTKRDNVRKNVSAWLKRPDLGMIPLFMAGDKHFFKIVNDLKRQTGIKLDLWSANPLENTDFKSGFCNVRPHFEKSRVDYLSFGRKVKMAAYFASRFVQNPRYINSSIFDTATAFASYYIEPRTDFFFMFDHMEWREDEVNKVIIDEYDFEKSPDSSSTWRIGDGTAAFYNYIYLTANGFTEFDTFRSNQIREGHISREYAMERVLDENQPRIESLRWYLETIGLDFNATIQKINSMDKRELHS